MVKMPAGPEERKRLAATPDPAQMVPAREVISLADVALLLPVLPVVRVRIFGAAAAVVDITAVAAAAALLETQLKRVGPAQEMSAHLAHGFQSVGRVGLRSAT